MSGKTTIENSLENRVESLEEEVKLLKQKIWGLELKLLEDKNRKEYPDIPHIPQAKDFYYIHDVIVTPDGYWQPYTGAWGGITPAPMTFVPKYSGTQYQISSLDLRK
jgi:hypothetical protein